MYPLQNPYSVSDRRACFRVSQLIIGSGARIIITSKIGPNAKRILQRHDVVFHTVPPGTRVIDTLGGAGLAG